MPCRMPLWVAQGVWELFRRGDQELVLQMQQQPHTLRAVEMDGWSLLPHAPASLLQHGPTSPRLPQSHVPPPPTEMWSIAHQLDRCSLHTPASPSHSFLPPRRTVPSPLSPRPVTGAAAAAAAPLLQLGPASGQGGGWAEPLAKPRGVVLTETRELGASGQLDELATGAPPAARARRRRRGAVTAWAACGGASRSCSPAGLGDGGGRAGGGNSHQGYAKMVHGEAC